MPRLTRFVMILSLGAGSLSFSGCAALVGGYSVPAGSTELRNYSSVAGDVEVGRRATVRDVDTVAGDIDVGDDSRVRSLESVAGDIRLGEKVTVEGSIETVAGDIDIETGCTIGGSIDTVAGDVRIVESLVKGDITTRHGDLHLTKTRIEGMVRIKRAKTDANDILRVTIGPGTVVPELIAEERVDLRLRIHRSAKVGRVIGATAEYYD